MLQLTHHADYKSAVLKNQFFKLPKDQFSAHPFSPKVVEWLTEKNISVIPVVSMAVDFFLGIYLNECVVRRADGYEKLDPTTNKKVWQPNDPAISAWAEKVSETHLENVDFIDKFMFTYLCAATAGELRHASSKLKHSGWNQEYVTKWDIPLGGGVSRASCQKTFLTKIKPEQTPAYLQDATDCFNKYSWGGSFGGKKWGDISSTGLHRIVGKTDRITFIDRVFDLKHNGGPMFDKNSVVHQNNLPSFLDSKFELVKDKQWHNWFQFGTRKICELVQEAQKLKLWQHEAVFNLPKLFSLHPEENKQKKQSSGDSSDDDEAPAQDHEEQVVLTFVIPTIECPKGLSHALTSG